MLPAIPKNAVRVKGNKTPMLTPRRGRYGVLGNQGAGRQNKTSSDFFQAVFPLPAIADKASATDANWFEKELSGLLNDASASSSGLSDAARGSNQAPAPVSLPSLSGRETSRGGREALEQDEPASRQHPWSSAAHSSQQAPDSLPSLSHQPTEPTSRIYPKEQQLGDMSSPVGVLSPSPISELSPSPVGVSPSPLGVSPSVLGVSPSPGGVSPSPVRETPSLIEASPSPARGACESRLTRDDSVVSVATTSRNTFRNSQRKEGRRLDMSQIQRQVRGNGLEAGDWNAGAFSAARQRLLAEGKLEAMPALTSMAAQASDAALEAGEYRLPPTAALEAGEHRLPPPACHVPIPRQAHVQFYGLDTLEPPAIQRGLQMAPPLICSSKRTLEAAREMVKMYPSHVVAASFDATDFSKDGKWLLGGQKAQSAAQQEMFIRTNFHYYCKTAQVWCGDMRMQEQLTAMTDPLALAASEVLIFRDPVEDGYRFLPPEELVAVNLLVTARSKVCPLQAAHGEYFAVQEDYLCYVDRLNLIARGAIAQGIQDHVANNGGTRDDVDKLLAESQKPVLVIGMQDLIVAAAQQPRQSIAMALKGWRLQWAHFFEAVVIACGDSDTATIMDKTVNGNIYAQVLTGNQCLEGWHWREDLLQLSVNNVLSNIKKGTMKRPTALQERASTLQAPAPIQVPQPSTKAREAADGKEPLSPKSARSRKTRDAADCQEPLSPRSRKTKDAGDGEEPLSPRSRKTRGAADGEEPLSPKSPRRKIGKLRGTQADSALPEDGGPRRKSLARSSVAMAEELSVLVTEHNSASQSQRGTMTANVWTRLPTFIKPKVETPRTVAPAPRQEDSRAVFERCLHMRVVDQHIHSKDVSLKRRFDYQHPDDAAHEAAVGEKRVLAVKVFADAGHHKENAKAKEDWLSKGAASLDMPDEVKAAISKEVVTAEIHDVIHLQTIDHEKKIFENVQNMAFTLDRRLHKLREEQRKKEALTQGNMQKVVLPVGIKSIHCATQVRS